MAPLVATMPLKPLSRARPKQDAGVVRVVLDDEQHGVALLDVVAVVLDVLLARDRQHREFARLRPLATRLAGAVRALLGPE